MLMVLLDAAEMSDTRLDLSEWWKRFAAKKDGLRTVIHDGEYQYSHSPALTYVERLIRTLEGCANEGPSGVQALEIRRLEWILERTAVLVHGRKDFPSTEPGLQKVMHDYLKAAFPDFVKKFQIPGGIKNFEPDCGIRDINAAIEFKFVRTQTAVATAISGVIEDIGGYRGSKDWTRFYSVFYQAHPFMTASEAAREITRAGGTAWTPYVVNGLTTKKRPAKNPPRVIAEARKAVVKKMR
jgi:hypothetical protein